MSRVILRGALVSLCALLAVAPTAMAWEAYVDVGHGVYDSSLNETTDPSYPVPDTSSFATGYTDTTKATGVRDWGSFQLKNYATGSNLGVQMSMSHTGVSVVEHDWWWQHNDSGNDGYFEDHGFTITGSRTSPTGEGKIFTDKVDLRQNIYGRPNDRATVTFSGLQSNKMYNVYVYGNRWTENQLSDYPSNAGEGYYTDRNTNVQITKAASFVNGTHTAASTAGVKTTTVADDTSWTNTGCGIDKTYNQYLSKFVNITAQDGEISLDVFGDQDKKWYLSAIMIVEGDNGDCNGDGVYNDAADLAVIREHLTESSFGTYGFHGGDIDADGDVDVNDLQAYLSAGLTKLGDADLDGDVDGADLVTWGTNYTGSGGTGLAWANGDFDGDGDVDGADLTTWGVNYTGTGDAQAMMAEIQASIPEPTTLALLGLGAVGLIRRRRRS